MPGEGRIEPLLQMEFLSAFRSGGRGELIHVPEFPGVDPVQWLGGAGLRKREEAFPNRGTLSALDESFFA